jgi:SAM-dependent methyltransferase
MLYVLQTIPGLAELAWAEAERALTKGSQRPHLVGTKAVPGRDDLILIDYSGSPRQLLNLRMSEDVFVVAARGFRVSGEERGLRQIHAAVRTSEQIAPALGIWRQIVGRRQGTTVFRVIARAVGKQRFMRRDLGRAVADGIRDGWPGQWRYVEEGGDVEIWATLIDDDLTVALRLSDASMRQRGKLKHLPASLRPALAAAMVHLSGPEPDDVFLDPMAGAGTILAERAAAGPYAEIHGGDISGEAVAAMQANLRTVKGRFHTSRWDARRLPLEDGEVDKVVVNLPFGKQISDEVVIHDLYQEFLAEMARVMRPGGRLVLLAGSVNAVERARLAAARSLRPGARHRVIVLGHPAMVLEYTRQSGPVHTPSRLVQAKREDPPPTPPDADLLDDGDYY